MKQFELGQLDSILLNLSNNGRTGRCHQSCVCLATESEQRAVPGEGNCQLGLMVDTSQQWPPAISQQQQAHQLVFLLLEDKGRTVSLRARDLLLQLDIFLDRSSVNFPILRITRLVWKQDERAYIRKWIGC